ncbi:MAG TPA: FimV/HubP family polar landmark protein [Acidiferrobacter sp.]|nr:FimV/HubP family polar landmark protein [Acidiferrobacter sp.]
MAKKGWQRSRIVPVIWAVAFLYAPLAQAFGLGQLTVESNLGQPLRAEVNLLGFQAADQNSVTAKLASSAAFAAAGIQKSQVLRTISCQIQRTPDGRYAVFLTSPTPINVPFLHFLLLLKSPNTTLLHEYTALLNPTSGVVTLNANSEASMQPLPLPVAPTQTPQQTARQRPLPQKTTVRRVHRGETLWAIALHTAPNRHAMPQTLEAFLHSNPHAFAHHNVNDLRVGATLRTPSRREILATPTHVAAKWLAAQDAAWAHYKTQLAKTPTETTGVSHGINGSVHSLRVLPKVHEALKIEPAQLNGGVLAAGGVAKGAPTRGALATRLGQLKKELQRTKHLLVLENQELAMLQHQARVQATSHPLVAGTIHAAPVTKAVTPIKGKVSPVKAKMSPVKGKAIVRKPVFVRAPIPPVAPAPSFLSMLMSSERLPILGALLVILLGGGLLLLRRRRRTMAEFEESILSGGGLNSESQMPDTAGLPKTPEVSFLSEFSQGGGIGAMHADEVDPLAEADVYLAYGRDEQAEEILKEAASKDPSRLELKSKLLEIYFQRNDTKTFEIVAEEIYAASSGQGTVWEKAEEMGRKLDPTNPLFKHGAGTAEARDTPSSGDARPSSGLGDRIDFAAVARELDEVSLPRSTSPSTENHDEGLEWTDAGLDAAKGAPSGAQTADENALDFSLDFSNTTDFTKEGANKGQGDEESKGSTAPTTAKKTGSDFSFDSGPDLNFQWDDTPVNPEKDTTSNEDFALQLDDKDFAGLTSEDLRPADPGLSGKDLSSESVFETSVEELAEEAEIVPAPEASGADVDAIETKLDLARTFLDMGDNEGARSILDEVRTEGSQAQRALADSLVAGIV